MRNDKDWSHNISPTINSTLSHDGGNVKEISFLPDYKQWATEKEKMGISSFSVACKHKKQTIFMVLLRYLLHTNTVCVLGMLVYSCFCRPSAIESHT